MDFEDSPSKFVPSEFLAVVLAGFGSGLVPLTNAYGDESCPKALLPIANRPMIDYPLTWLEQSGIVDVLLICPAVHRASISHHIHSDISSSSYPSLSIDLQAYEESDEFALGTCAILRQFSHRIDRDFIILPCDFIPPPALHLTAIINKFRSDTVSDSAVVTSCWFEPQRSEKNVFPEEWSHTNGVTPIIWNEHTGTLLYVDTPDEVDKNGDELELKMSVLRRYPKSHLSSRYQDSHIYVCSKSILEVLQRRVSFESFREEFIPWLCKLQCQKYSKYGQVFSSSSTNGPHALALRHSLLYSGAALTDLSNISAMEENDSPLHKPGPLSVPSSPIGASRDKSHSPISLRVGIVIHETGPAARANNLQTFLDLNRQFLNEANWSLPTDPENRILIDPKSQISNDSMVGQSTQIGERTSIKHSVIGKHCVIGRSVRITGCVVFDHCVISDGVKLDGCILGMNTKVGARAELTRCVTQAGYEVDAGGTFKHEKLEVSDWAAASHDDEADEMDESAETKSSNEE